jgi:hypothetical protein
VTGDARDLIAGVLNAHDPEASARKARDMIEERAAYAQQLAETAGRFPSYEVPPEVAARFPGFDPGDPRTWPEPEKCTEGRPWGIDAYGSVWGDPGRRWQAYLTGPHPRACRNRWKDPVTHLCGTHLNAYRQVLRDNELRLARYAREEEHGALAKRLGELYSIEATGSVAGVILSADAARQVLDLLARGPVPLTGPYAPTPDTYTE